MPHSESRIVRSAPSIRRICGDLAHRRRPSVEVEAVRGPLVVHLEVEVAVVVEVPEDRRPAHLVVDDAPSILRLLVGAVAPARQQRVRAPEGRHRRGDVGQGEVREPVAVEVGERHPEVRPATRGGIGFHRVQHAPTRRFARERNRRLLCGGGVHARKGRDLKPPCGQRRQGERGSHPPRSAVTRGRGRIAGRFLRRSRGICHRTRLHGPGSE